MQNHSLSLHPEKGKGSHPDIGCDKIEGNLLHEDLEEAVDFIKPAFLMNIIPGKEGPGARGGHYREAHRAGTGNSVIFSVSPYRKKGRWFWLPPEDSRGI